MTITNTLEQRTPPLFSKPGAAKYLGVSKDTIDRMIDLKQLEPVRIGDRDMVRHIDLAALIGAM
jgi:excisionase family DNA binding protein